MGAAFSKIQSFGSLGTSNCLKDIFAYSISFGMHFSLVLRGNYGIVRLRVSIEY